MTPEEADAKQEWKGMGLATAFEIIDRTSNAPDDERQLLNAWSRANQGPIIGPDLSPHAIKSALQNLNDIEIIMGGLNGPSIQLRAFLNRLSEE